MAQAKAKILVVRDIERDDIEFISKTLGCLPIADSEHMKPEKLGHASLVAEVSVRPDAMSAHTGPIQQDWHSCRHLSVCGTCQTLVAVAVLCIRAGVLTKAVLYI